MSVQALRSELPIERLDEGIVGRLSGPRKVEHNAPRVRPQIQILRHELGPLIDADHLWKAILPPHALQRFDDIRRSEAEARFDRRREPAAGIDDRQHADLLPGSQLVMDEVHGPNFVRGRRRLAVIAQLRLHPSLGRFVAQLQA